MGGSSSKVKQLNKSIINITTQVVAKSSSSASGSIVATQDLVFAGTGSNIDILQNSKISLDVLQKSDVNSAMQTEIISSILAEVDKTKSGLPELSSSKSNTEIKNIVESNVMSTFSQESLAQLSISIELNQNVAFLKGSAYEYVKLEQSAEGVGKLINDMSGSITSQLVSGTELASQTTEITENPVSSVVKSVGDAMGSVITNMSDAFGLDPTTIILLIVVVVVGYFLASKQLDKMPGPHRIRRRPAGKPLRPKVM